ncbi:hypothetical protein AB1Y20_022292 [Prymnesium parvum]|uniref:Protein kinase domain-containing protein n=1 Tax=Prymnesium parvum TaxID=97485 RepID=A0AB34JID2_PRYPA
MLLWISIVAGLGVLLGLATLLAACLYLRLRRQRRALSDVRKREQERSGTCPSTMSDTSGTPRTPRAADPLRRTAIPPSELVLEQLLGHGAFGEVFQAQWCGTPVAVKRLAKRRINKGTLTAFQNEFELQLTLRHPNIVLLLGGSWTEDEAQPQVTLVMEYCSNGSLAAFLVDSARPLRWAEHRVPIAVGIARAITYLHAHDVVHRDLKPANVLLDASMTAKVGDFGTSRELIGGARGKVGTPLYSAPEILRQQPHHSPVDVWSYGCLLCCLHHRTLQWVEPGASPSETLRLVADGKLSPSVPAATPFHQVVEQCATFDPEGRPSAAALLSLVRSAEVLELAAAADVEAAPCDASKGEAAERSEEAGGEAEARSEALSSRESWPWPEAAVCVLPVGGEARRREEGGEAPAAAAREHSRSVPLASAARAAATRVAAARVAAARRALAASARVAAARRAAAAAAFARPSPRALSGRAGGPPRLAAKGRAAGGEAARLGGLYHV